MRVLIVALALFAAAPAAATTFVLDDFSGPTPAIAVDSSTGTFGIDGQGPYGRYVVSNAFAPGPISYRIGNGSLIRRPANDTAGETVIGYLRYGVPPFIAPLDLSGFRYVRFDFNDVTVGDPFNLNVEFFTPGVSAAKPLYYGLASLNWFFTSSHRSAYLDMAPAAAAFNFTNVQGIGVLIDRSGFGRNGFTLDRIAFTDVGPGVPEPASWALMVAGFGLVGAVARRRSSRSVAA